MQGMNLQRVSQKYATNAMCDYTVKKINKKDYEVKLFIDFIKDSYKKNIAFLKWTFSPNRSMYEEALEAKLKIAERDREYWKESAADWARKAIREAQK